jgi:RNA polymerase sigma factor (sigma-70 family)
MNLYQNLDINELVLKSRERDDMAFAEIVTRYTPMLNKVISGFSGNSVSYDEAFSEACVALHKSVLSYDIARTGITFGLYARICVQRRLSDLYSASVDKAVDTEVGLDNIAVGTSAESVLLFKERVEKFISVARKILSDYEYSVFLLYIQGYDTAMMCEELSKDKKSVENAKARMLKNLRSESHLFRDV